MKGLLQELVARDPEMKACFTTIEAERIRKEEEEQLIEGLIQELEASEQRVSDLSNEIERLESSKDYQLSNEEARLAEIEIESLRQELAAE